MQQRGSYNENTQNQYGIGGSGSHSLDRLTKYMPELSTLLATIGQFEQEGNQSARDMERYQIMEKVDQIANTLKQKLRGSIKK